MAKPAELLKTKEGRGGEGGNQIAGAIDTDDRQTRFVRADVSGQSINTTESKREN